MHYLLPEQRCEAADGPHRPYKRATVAATALQHGMVKILELRKANLERKVKELRGEEKCAMEAWIKRIDALIHPAGPLYQTRPIPESKRL